MSRKIKVLNSPWGREIERPYDCKIWCDKGLAYMTADGLMFRANYLESIRRRQAEADPTGFDDGTARRWVNRPSGTMDLAGEVALDGQLLDKCIAISPGGLDIKQLVEVKFVGTAKGVTNNPDKLTRRHRRFRTLTPIKPCGTD